MKKGFRAGIEMIRVAILSIIIGVLSGGFLKLVYSSFGVNMGDTNGTWLVGISILLILFVLYRNKLQFSGYYKSDKNVKLPRTISIILVSISIILLIVAPVIN